MFCKEKHLYIWIKIVDFYSIKTSNRQQKAKGNIVIRAYTKVC